jgi:2-polyprenyl-3-methyl-5-hydroxy-6-metoxy-1,4-benzoquinol methylase
MIIIKKKIDTIIKTFKKINLTKLNLKFVINEILFLNLSLEKLLFDKKNLKGNPVEVISIHLDNLLFKLNNINDFKDFDKKITVKHSEFIREKAHKEIFNSLWTRFTPAEYKKERIGRYLQRIKINKLKPIIKDKKIIDFGCGHGNFLLSCYYNGAKFCCGVDYGKDSIKYANTIIKKLKISNNRVKFKIKSVYKTGEKNEFFDFAIQNGVFHHLDNEFLAYKEVYRVLKPGGYMWLYTDGGGGIRDAVYDMSQKMLKKIDKKFVINEIRSLGLTTNKEYHFGDGMNAEYRHTTYNKIIKKLSLIGFKNFKQLSGGFSTDFDKPFTNDKYFKEKFGSGDLRFICQK